MSVTQGAPAALAEPVVPVRRSWIGLLFAANLGLWMVFFTPVQVLLPEQIDDLGVAGKEAALGWVTALGALVAIVVNPAAGALSDRTRLRLGNRAYGRRHVWTLAGTVVTVLSLVVLAGAGNLATVALGWAGAQVGLNVMLATLTAAVPDRVPVLQRGLVSGWIGMPQALGLVLGAVLVTAVVTATFSGYVLIAVVLCALAVPFVVLTPDDPLPATAGTRAPSTKLWRIFAENPDYAWAWGTRFLIQLGNALGTLYMLYFLTDEVRVADPDTGLLISILIYTAGMVATAVIGGRISDRTGRRKVFVVWSGMVIAVAALLLAIWPTWTATLIAAALFGAGYGVYLAVDTALITQVLPAAVDRAKDLGVINIATAAPQVLGPAMAAPIVTHLGGYPALYVLTAVVTVLGAVFVVRIRSVP
ncbi:MFS transporter [Actinoplanes sp. N902-109]|uniref:MFS transporter n=1 Tax=Actinoplanes sp. (strain N902-109) TaxID=649831 RepID=UPI0003293EA6|nr:MFS transporter [Actinoplanes sp. N902-109]AGL15281.1 major facilitator superfamily protein [Actinoplanes sp. N902-109]